RLLRRRPIRISDERSGGPPPGSFLRANCPRCAERNGSPARRRVPPAGVSARMRFEDGRTGASSFARLRRQKSVKDCRRLPPTTSFLFNLFLASSRQTVILCSPVVVRNTPSRRNVAFLFEPQQRGVDRSVVHGQLVPA